MEDNLSIDDLKLRLGSFADEKETMRILKENNLLESSKSIYNSNLS